MNFKHIIFLLFTVSVSAFFSGCASVESKSAEEVEISSSKGSSEEVYITTADIKPKDQEISTVQKSGQLDKRTLSDKSQIESLVDGFGNKAETRYFSGHPRLRLLILRTSVDGKREVTVYGNGGDTKIVPGLGDRALTSSADEIADAAQLYATPGYGGAKNFMKRTKTQSQTPLQPLPSSSFQQPVSQVNQPVESVQTEPNRSSDNPATRQNNPDEK